jgi:hypothetical protein
MLFFVAFFLVVLTGIDWVVHSVLYDFGLEFSYSWANPYWVFLGLCFVAAGAVAEMSYFLHRRIDRKVFLRGSLIFWTVLSQTLSGNLDLLWFLFNYLFKGVWFPAWDAVWWWHWGSLLGLSVTTFWVVVVGLVWNVVLAGVWILCFVRRWW